MNNITADVDALQQGFQEDTQQGLFLSLSLGEEIFALEIKYVTEIVGVQPITPIPEVPEYVKGVINLRGKIIPVIDMRLKFRKPPIEYTDRTCIIVVDIEEMSVGLIVDNVVEVVTIPAGSIVPPPDSRTGIQNRYLKGIGMVDSKVILLLESSKILSEEDFEELSEIKTK